MSDKKARPFRKVLVANRGEIAIRILRACQEVGLKTVAVYSEADRESLHLEHCDEAYCVGPPPAAQSYLDIPKILDVARRSGVGAIHPGYGFLSEREAFARAVEDAGFVFVGPQPEVIEAMGEKVSARRLMKSFGVPTIPGSEGSVPTAAEARELAASFGFPVLLKAAGGGGGKGMRIVHREEDVEEAYRQAQAEATKAFGNPDVFLEKYVSPARHIEIQVLGDTHGNFVHLGERECSVQRRFQKLVEETPSPFVDAEMRRRMGETAVHAARALGYRNAGTFEFVADADRNFYFLEVNTRLQVEHPVTELVSGIDIVKEQLRIAMGEPMSPAALAYGADPRPHGHAIECRINAESPRANFAPATGRIHFLRLPDGPGIRVDRSMRPGSEISMWYDPMIAKLIVWAVTRDEALARMRRALDEFEILGVDTTLEFHRWLLDHPMFASNDVHTKFVEEHFGPDRLQERSDPELMAVAAALLYHFEGRRTSPAGATAAAAGGPGSRWRAVGLHEAAGRP
ncbi:acetyl-CoA carboxylase biotin carboxylase subunit [Acidobacteria bacterium ACD]|nr:MAG: acetyl-CoA carboxylase biotin carboxylase subunit [Acidobacteriota bacterium]MDL1950579.1 acetyl-CoA carboxylase biotin carboxylase subunit [Acidobacteria bacterium ACD]